MFEHFIPEFAERKSTGNYLVPMTQLCTRDGRRTGNAVVVSVTGRTACVMTDMGNSMILTKGELKELFHAPEYILQDHPYVGGRDAEDS